MTTDTKVAELPAALAKIVEAAGLMLSEIDTCGHQVDPAYRATLHDAWTTGRAALSRQDAQVEDWKTDWYARREEHARGMGYAGLADALDDLQTRRDAVALAARPPVGQVVDQFKAGQSLIDWNRNLPDPYIRQGYELVVLDHVHRYYAAPPAQVDLELWTKAKPTQPGIYAVRRFHYGHPNDYAVVEVVERDGELQSSLHQRNSEWPLADRYDARIADMSDRFEWLKVAPPIDQQAGKGMDL